MAGAAFLPWEQWLPRLLHPLAVRFKRWLNDNQRRCWLARSEGWPETEGTVSSVGWDSSFPRENLLYSYSTERGYYSGSYWHWFERTKAREIKPGDRVQLRYSAENPEESVVLRVI